MKFFLLLITVSFSACYHDYETRDLLDNLDLCKELYNKITNASKTNKAYRAKECCQCKWPESQPFSAIKGCYEDSRCTNDTNGCFAYKCSFENFNVNGTYKPEGLKANCMTSISEGNSIQKWEPIIDASIKKCEDKRKFLNFKG